VLLRVKLDTVPAFNVFLNFHPHDVGVDGQGHLVRHRVDLTLFLFDRPTHVVKTFFDGELKLFFRLNFL